MSSLKEIEKEFSMNKKYFVPLLGSLVLMAGCAGQPEHKKEEHKAPAPEGELNKHDVSYALGYNVGDVLVKTDPELSLNDLIQGLKDAYGKTASPKINQEEVKKLLMMYNVEVSKKMQEKQQAAREENVKKGQTFAAEYEKAGGVKKLEGGVLYKIIEEGKGPIPSKDDVVVVDYVGKKIDGTEFSSSKATGQPAEFPLHGVIRGWTAALQQMPVGSTWEVVIPPDFAYGDRGAGEVIAPGETLVFQIHLIKIKEKENKTSQETKK